MKRIIIDKAVKIYCNIFKTKETQEQRKFIEDLLFVFIATGIAKGLILIMNIVAGRLLGPTIYGEYTLILTIAMFLTIPAALGIMGGITKTLAETEKYEKRKKIISTATNYYILTTLFLILIYLFFNKEILLITKTESNLTLLSIILFVFWSSTGLIESILQGFREQKKWSYIQIISYMISFFVFAYFVFSGRLNIMMMYVPLLITYFGFMISSPLIIGKYYSIKIFDKAVFKDMFGYGFYVLITTIATTFLGNIDKIMINHFMGAESVGIYQAYFFSSIMIIGVVTGVFVKVFFPTAVKLKDPSGMLKKLDKIAIIGFIITIIFVPILTRIIIFLYDYEFILTTSLLFALATGASVFLVLYSALLSAQGKESVKKTTIGLVAAFILNIPINYFLIPIIGINGAIIATTISFLFLFIYIRIKIMKM